MRNYAAMLGVVLWGCYMASGATHYVVPVGTPGTPTANYLTWDTAATSIQEAVAVATNGSLVLVTNGTYAMTGMVVVGNAITVRSFNNGVTDPDGTILNGNYPAYTNRCLLVTNWGAVVDGFTITNGYADFGGGVQMTRGMLTNCAISGCYAPTNAGGLYLVGGTVTACRVIANAATNVTPAAGGYGGGAMMAGGLLTNCIVSANRSGLQGGGIYMSVGSVANCWIQNNRAAPLPGVGGQGAQGGGVYWTGGGTIIASYLISNTVNASTGGSGSSAYSGGVTVGSGGTIRDSVIAYNTGAGYGGGVSAGAGRTVSNCVIRNNSASNGGGVYLSGNGLITHCTIVSNTIGVWSQGGTVRNCLLAYNGGGIQQYTAIGLFQSCTIASNGYGMAFGGSGAVTGMVDNCIVYWNGATGTNYSRTATAFPFWTNSCTTPLPTGTYDVANISSDPQFVNRSSGDFRLKRTSSCINAGVNRSWMTNAVDLDGQVRIQEDTVDMGAYEIVPRPGTLIYFR